jgi:hypothetical protein
MASLEPARASQNLTDYSVVHLDRVRAAIAPEDRVLAEARARRNTVTRSARSFYGGLRTFNSGSLAHGNVNNPVSDADCGFALDRRSYIELGPDGDGFGPNDIMLEVAEFVMEPVREVYPSATYTLIKRAILIEFNEPIDDEDPSVDLIVALTRKDEPGLWIPNRECDSWDASDPEKHTELLLGPTRSLRVHRARVIRLAKAAIKEGGNPALSSFNVEALALLYVQETGAISDGLRDLFVYGATDLARRLTPDPAGVSKPIKLLAPHDEVVRRMQFLAGKLDDAVEHRYDEERVREALAAVFPSHIAPPASSSKLKLISSVRDGGGGAAAATFGLGTGLKPVRSSGGGDVPAA